MLSLLATALVVFLSPPPDLAPDSAESDEVESEEVGSDSEVESEEVATDTVDASPEAKDESVTDADPPPATIAHEPGFPGPPALTPAQWEVLVVNMRPKYKKRTGLLITSGVMVGVGWLTMVGRMLLVTHCAEAVEGATQVQTSAAAVDATTTCATQAGIGNLLLFPIQYSANATAWGLATGGSMARGRHDGVEDAWAGKPRRKSAAFIGAGGAMLGLGIAARIVAAAFTPRPFRHLGVVTNSDDVAAFTKEYRARMAGVQLSSTTIAAGAGLLAYGIAYRKAYKDQSGVLQRVRVTADTNVDPRSGLFYAGVALTGRF